MATRTWRDGWLTVLVSTLELHFDFRFFTYGYNVGRYRENIMAYRWMAFTVYGLGFERNVVSHVFMLYGR